MYVKWTFKCLKRNKVQTFDLGHSKVGRVTAGHVPDSTVLLVQIIDTAGHQLVPCFGVAKTTVSAKSPGVGLNHDIVRKFIYGHYLNSYNLTRMFCAFTESSFCARPHIFKINWKWGEEGCFPMPNPNPAVFLSTSYNLTSPKFSHKQANPPPPPVFDTCSLSQHTI